MAYGGKMIPVPSTETNFGPPANRPGLVKLRMVTTESGAPAAAALGARMRDLTARSHAPMSGAELLDFKRVSTFDVVTDPATLKPVYARSERHSTIKANDGNGADSEVHEYTFEWGPALRRNASDSSAAARCGDSLRRRLQCRPDPAAGTGRSRLPTSGAPECPARQDI
jgi:hypothetical protein